MLVVLGFGQEALRDLLSLDAVDPPNTKTLLGLQQMRQDAPDENEVHQAGHVQVCIRDSESKTPRRRIPLQQGPQEGPPYVGNPQVGLRVWDGILKLSSLEVQDS